MTKLLDEAIEKLRNLPDNDQDIAAKFLLEFANPDQRNVRLNEAQIAEIKLAQEEVREGKFATDAEMTEVWQHFAS